MRDLRLVGLSEDRRHVVLRSDTDEEFRVPADDSLRGALQSAQRDDRPRSGQLETKMDSALRPRDIQARIRAGASPEEVADVAAVPVDKIMGYAVPVLAERAHIAERARTATVRRKHTEGPTRQLGDVVTQQLRARGTEPDDAAWDSWRRDDGRWFVTVNPAGSEDTGRYVFDVPGRFVVADDDLARALVADEPSVGDPTEMAIASAVAEGSLTSAVPASARLDEEDEPTRELPDDGPVTEPGPDDPTDDPTGDRAEATPIGGAVSRLRRRRPLHQVPDALPLDEPDGPGQADEAGAPPEGEGSPEEVRRPEPRRRRGARGRASVPSWDEIMFGGGKQER